jgi:glycine dehydrogenase
MRQPTESESKLEVDRFIDAMIAIRHEISDIDKGRFTKDESPLSDAPHTVLDIADDKWTRKYSRKEGCFPGGQSAKDKYWSPSNRIDNAYGDRNIVCSCPPIADYDQAAE